MREKPRAFALIFFSVLSVGVLAIRAIRATRAVADDSSVSPYIDKLQKQLREQDEKQGKKSESNPSVPDPYIESLKRKLPPSTEEGPGGPTQPYIDQLKREHPAEFANPPGQSYIDEERAKLPPEQTGGAIEAVKEGRSDLKMKRPGKVTGTFGFKVGTVMGHVITGSSSTILQPFQNVYGSGFHPDFTFYDEWMPFRSRILGSLGLIAQAGLSIYSGYGKFALTDLTRPGDGSPFGTVSQTQFKFFAIPVSAGAEYRFDLGKYLRPFVELTPTLMMYLETRSDGLSGHQGLSEGITASAGAYILMDWISRDATWNLYEDYGIKHVYFTLEYEQLSTFGGAVSFSFSGALAGVSFDF